MFGMCSEEFSGTRFAAALAAFGNYGRRHCTIFDGRILLINDDLDSLLFVFFFG